MVRGCNASRGTEGRTSSPRRRRGLRGVGVHQHSNTPDTFLSTFLSAVCLSTPIETKKMTILYTYGKRKSSRTKGGQEAEEG